MSNSLKIGFQPLEESSSDNKLLNSFYSKRIPSKFKKTLYLCIFLLILGLGLIVIGTIIAISSNNVQDAFSYYILGIICLIPGVYYTIQFIRAKSEEDEEYRREILDEIPTL